MAQAQFLGKISDIEPSAWDGLFGTGHPFVSHAFLQALEESGCVSADTGWQPRHLLLNGPNGVQAAMPLYLKSHSYGEFVFDWGWAAAYERMGHSYYPKLLTAIPFTPVRGPRLGIRPGHDATSLARDASRAVRMLVEREGLSGWHVLFPDEPLERALGQPGVDLLAREDVQFHWFNRGDADFDAFLGRLKSSRRKGIRRERRRVAEQGVRVRRLTGADIGATEWADFYRCYVRTYMKRSGHEGYLNEAFFARLLGDLRECLMLVIAEREGRTVASALFLFDAETLYGRYWGALAPVNCLHFEACFYQGIEFCIERGLRRFDPGAQGEHKLLRGFEPVTTHSRHWLADERFRDLVEDHLARERRSMRSYGDRAGQFLPFRQDR